VYQYKTPLNFNKMNFVISDDTPLFSVASSATNQEVSGENGTVDPMRG
jgi:hypothetical protein